MIKLLRIQLEEEKKLRSEERLRREEQEKDEVRRQEEEKEEQKKEREILEERNRKLAKDVEGMKDELRGLWMRVEGLEEDDVNREEERMSSRWWRKRISSRWWRRRRWSWWRRCGGGSRGGELLEVMEEEDELCQLSCRDLCRICRMSFRRDLWWICRILRW